MKSLIECLIVSCVIMVGIVVVILTWPFVGHHGVD